MGTIGVLLVDDHTIVRKGLRSILDAEEDIKVTGEAQNGREAIEEVRHSRPDVVVMDIGMPGLNGLEATRRIRKSFPKVQVVALTMHTDEEYVVQALRAGAAGYVVKQAAPTELISAIRAAHQGLMFLSPSVCRSVVERQLKAAGDKRKPDRYDSLSAREREILQLIAEGHGNKQMALLLKISIRTLEVHKTHLMDKLDIRTTAGLTRFAIGRGLVASEP